MFKHNQYLKRLAVAGILLFSLSTAACYHSYRELRGELTESSLIGNWTVLPQSIELLREKKICCTDNEISLQITEDHRFELLNMPDAWIREDPIASMARVQGTWSVSNTSRSPSFHLEFNGMIHGVGVGEKSGKMVIVIGWGDPDSGNWIYFTKDK